jgi:hypothetical protein
MSLQFRLFEGGGDAAHLINAVQVRFMFFGLLDPDPDPSSSSKSSKINLDSCCFVGFFMTLYL